MTKVDARGLNCPEPVLLTKRALEQGAPVVVLVDDKTPLMNITRFAENAGYQVSHELVDGDYASTIQA